MKKLFFVLGALFLLNTFAFADNSGYEFVFLKAGDDLLASMGSTSHSQEVNLANQKAQELYQIKAEIEKHNYKIEQIEEDNTIPETRKQSELRTLERELEYLELKREELE